ncbi:MAG: type I DNA topoisomerase [Bacteroidales bacterium]|nr:type I DNA topoisomerase [Bacteroidales bacterium]
MAKNLVIVESPAKAKTIEKFLGEEYVVRSSYGHIRDLSEKKLSIDVENEFAPTYEVPSDKKEVVAQLKKLTSKAEVIWLATDEDREGEAIAWHLKETLELDDNKTKRIVFHEITKSAIQEAIENPRKIDKHLVDAQQARRVLDRLVGFELSPILWRKVKPSLSAGRVQSVTVRLIVEREKEINAFNTTSFFRVVGDFILSDNTVVKAELSNKFESKEKALEFINKCIGAEYKVENLETKPSKKTPSPPFTTSTLQQEASRKLGFSVSKTMVIAQQLYESGKITYMRTDSVSLSNLALGTAKEEIIKLYGEKYVHTRQYTTKTKGAQEAHEAIRPTYISNQNIEGDSSQKRLYDLIWKRTIASQMTEASIEKTNVTIGISKTEEKFIAKGEIIIFDGFLKVYMESSDEENEENNKENKDMLPPLKIGEILNVKIINATESFTLHPPRYTEASLVKKLEELGIGRPSTYAPTISTIQKREYVVNESREGTKRNFDILILANDKISEKTESQNTGYEKSKLFPTDIGFVVNEFLVKTFEDILDYNFTASVEKEFDEIAQGDKVWNEMIKNFYGPFHKNVSATLEDKSKAQGEKLLGIDKETGKNVYVKIGRFGPVAQLGESDLPEKPRFAGLLKNQSIETITLEEVMDLFKLPKNIGEFESEIMTIGVGRFGPYVKHNNSFYSLSKDDDPLTITRERAIEIIEEKRKRNLEREVKTFDERNDIKILKGRWGNYLVIGKENFKLPKDKKDVANLTVEDCLKIAEEDKKNEKPARKSKKKYYVKK